MSGAYASDGSGDAVLTESDVWALLQPVANNAIPAIPAAKAMAHRLVNVIGPFTGQAIAAATRARCKVPASLFCAHHIRRRLHHDSQ
ncbi:hypothetical protein GCM10023353_06510 [Tomitella cavernea]|uniref:Uncharacterized protein n=1 Tax=Tomitella cavernea TaxID=1387982 RepID=A0ABP9C782_9ACTN